MRQFSRYGRADVSTPEGMEKWRQPEGKLHVAGQAETLLATLKERQSFTSEQALKVAKSLGMRGTIGYSLKGRVMFLLRKYGEKRDGSWRIVKPIEPPFWT